MPLPWLSIADLFLLPSAQESFGLSALEAMACEVPVIASQVGGLPEVVTEGVTGHLRAPEDTEGMATAALALLQDPARRAAMGRAAADDVRRRFQQDTVVPVYERLYEEVIAAGAPDVRLRHGGGFGPVPRFLTPVKCSSMSIRHAALRLAMVVTLARRR